MVKRYNIVTRSVYTKKDGTEKVNWLTVGTLSEFEDGKALELNMFPGTKFYVFEIKPKEQGQSGEQVVNPAELPDFGLDFDSVTNDPIEDMPL
jgi:hypothetical protein